MREHLRIGKVVDGDNLIPFGAEHLPERQTTDTPETVNTNFYCHG
jgi:hypothetical protein